MNNNNTVIIKVCGENLENFFQNIISNDIKKASNNCLLYSALLNPQGKFLHDFFIKKENNCFLIEVNKNEGENLISVLKSYDLRESFTFSIINRKFVKVFIYDEVIKYMSDSFIANKYEKNDHYDAFMDPRADKLFIRFWIKKGKEVKELNKLKDFSQNLLELHRIKNCIPNSEIDLEKNKSFILNYKFDEISAISFKKGCYVGQENTAKQKYRGKQKYKLKLLKLISGNFPAINENLIISDKKIGVMKSFAYDYGLALVRQDFKELNNDLEIKNILSVISIL